MFLTGKAAYAGIVVLLLTAWISGPSPTPVTSRAGLTNEAQDLSDPNDVSKTQRALQDKGHYRGPIDGVFGLRTRASIRGFQKTESLTVTGQLDAQTAHKLGVAPEGRAEASDGTMPGKPSAGRKKSPRRISKAGRNATETVAGPESGRGHSGKTLQGEDDTHDK